MEIPKSLKIGAIVLTGIIFAFAAGYVIFSYFSREENPANTAQNTEAPVDVENDEATDTNGSVAGAADDSEGISPLGSPRPTPVSPTTDSSTNINNQMKGGVLGETTTDSNGITPNNATPRRTTITEEDREAAKKKDSSDNEVEDTSDSEVYLLGGPEIDEDDDYVEYTYTFEFNDDAQKRYKNGFTYSIDAQNCKDNYFTSSKYDFKGTINDVDDEVEIVVRIDKDHLDDIDDFEDSEYKLEGTRYIVEGDIRVPQCTD